MDGQTVQIIALSAHGSVRRQVSICQKHIKTP